MRPRPDAAENPQREVALHAARPASMRPRPDAAENGSVLSSGRVVFTALQ